MRIKSVLLAALAASVLTVSCEKEIDYGPASLRLETDELTFGTEESTALVTINATRDWFVRDGLPDWITVEPDHGPASLEPQQVVIKVPANTKMDRNGTVVFTIGFEKTGISVFQQGEAGSEADALMYYNNFDKEVAEKNYGSGTSWPYLDQFEGWKNETGKGAESVTYEFSGMSARANSESNSKYSDYEGSGYNNLFFGSNPAFKILDIGITGTTFQLSFGSERYQNGVDDNTFRHDEFHVFLSVDKEKWVDVEYEFPNGDKNGRWDQASVTFEVPEGTEKLSVGFYSTLASSYRVDDVRLIKSGESGLEPLDFENGVAFGTVDNGGGGGGEDTGDAIYYNNFDKEKAEKTYGSSQSSYPYLDQFEGWKNETGTGANDVRYEFKAMSARSNSESNSNYSDYKGSGVNNLFFGADNLFKISNIALGSATNLTLSFGSERYLYGDSDNTFKHNEFHVYVSNDGEKWVEVTYAFPNGDKNGRWDQASTTFTVPSGTANLSLYFKVDVGSAYRLDDVKLVASETAGTAIDFSKGISLEGGESSGGGGGGEGGGGGDTSGAIFFNNFDKEKATQTFGSGTSWPYLDQFEGWKNETGSGASGVSYEFKAVSARANSESNSNYSDYEGSGANNLFFGASNLFKISNIAIGSATNLTLSFGSERYLYGDNDNTFKHTEFHVYVSNDGEKWVEVTYAFPSGDKSGRWDQASTTFTVPSGTANISLYFKVDVASAYRLDDVKLVASETAGTALDFTKGISLEGGESSGGGGQGGGGDQGGGGGDVNASSLADILKAADKTAVAAKDVYVGAVTSKGFMATDGTNHIYVYQNATPSVSVGDIVTFSGTKDTYYGMPEITEPKVTKTGSGTTPYPTPKDITSTFDSYDNTVGEYIVFSATVVKSGNYTNFQVAGATKYTGALSSGTNALYNGLNAGDKVNVYGYFNGHNTNSNLLNVVGVKIENAGAAPSGYGAKTATAKWLELPETKADDEWEWFYHTASLNNKNVRNYSFEWNYGDRVSMWVAYPLYTAIIGKGSRSEAWNYDRTSKPGVIPDALQQNVSKGYKSGNNGSYDRGHQLPSADRLGSTALNESTFYGVNMTPQKNKFNAGLWANLESKVRGWATSSDTLYVVTGCVTEGAKYYVLDQSDHKVTAPTAYFKAVLRYKAGATIGSQGYVAAAFYYDMAKYDTSSESSVTKAQSMSVSELEAKLGYKLFVNLADKVGSTDAQKIKDQKPADVSWWW